MIDFTKKFKNTDKFRQAAIFFEKNRYYADLDDYDYWDEESKRCKEGYTVDGDYITGYHYFYLNYSPITKKVPYEIINKKTGKRRMDLERVPGFLRFYDYDSFFYEYCEELMFDRLHGAVMKARERGYSFKAASMLACNYTFIPGSKGYAIAANEDFLTRDGLLTKCWDILNHLQKTTPWGWLRTVDQKMHKRAGYKAKNPHTGKVEEQGFLSEIIGISINKDPDKIRGIRGVGRNCIMVWEELGLNPWLKQLWEAARPTMNTGFMLAIGTGSIDNDAVLGLKGLFYQPSAYNVYSLKNIWDEHMGDTECLFFCPQYTNMDDIDEETGEMIYMDKDGNTLTEKAKEKLTLDLEALIAANADSRSIDQYMIEHSRCPMESFLESGGNLFPKKRLMEQELKIRTNSTLYNFKQVGDLKETDDGEIVWKKQSYGDITQYPLSLKDKAEGLIVIWEHPKPAMISFQYVIGVDPYDVDLANESTSLGSCIVWKRFCPGDDFSDCIVLEYSGRPEKADDFYERVRLLLKYYNATVMSENMNRGIFTYFRIKQCEYLLARQPDGVLSDILKSSNVHRGYGVHMTTGIRDTLLAWLNDKLREEYGPDTDHITRILSIPILQELQLYNHKRNCDRVSLLLVLMIYLKQLERFKLKEIDPNLQEQKSRWQRPFFLSNPYRL